MVFWTLFLPLTALFFSFYFYGINGLFNGKKTKFIIDPAYDRQPVKREILFTVSSLVLFAGAGYLTGWLLENNIGFGYSGTPESIWGFIYMVLSFFIAFIIQDIYFYWCHRLLHTKLFFRYVHNWHHRSHNTNAWSAFSFHPVEAIFQIGIIPLLILIVPIHELALACFSILLLLISVYGHCGYELRHNKLKQFDVFNSSLHHFQHHAYVHYNFGIFLTIWDKWFGTEYPKYEGELDELRKRINHQA